MNIVIFGLGLFAGDGSVGVLLEDQLDRLLHPLPRKSFHVFNFHFHFNIIIWEGDPLKATPRTPFA